jgi:hypothetical protein
VLGNLENQGVIVPPSSRNSYYTVYQDLDEKPNTVIDIESEGAHNEVVQEETKPAAENQDAEIQLDNQGESQVSPPIEEEAKPEGEEKQVKAHEENSNNDIEVVMDNNPEEGKKTGAKSAEKGSAIKDSARKSSRKSTNKSASKSAIKEPADYDNDELADN